MNIQNTNYCSRAIDDISKAERIMMRGIVPTSESDLVQYAWFKRQLQVAEKFRLPDFGCLLDWPPGNTLKHYVAGYARPFRLPYPVVAIEYQHPEPNVNDGSIRLSYNATIAIAAEESVGGNEGIVVTAVSNLRYADRAMWTPNDFSVFIVESGDFGVLANSTKAQAELDKRSEDDAAQLVLTNLEGEMRATVQLICALACKNIFVANINAPAALNKKRIARGDTPFYSYHVLELNADTGHSQSRSDDGRHASPRMHLRRGHIRRLSDRNVWVNACVVKGLSPGFVDKSYRIRDGAFSEPTV